MCYVIKFSVNFVNECIVVEVVRAQNLDSYPLLSYENSWLVDQLFPVRICDVWWARASTSLQQLSTANLLIKVYSLELAPQRGTVQKFNCYLFYNNNKTQKVINHSLFVVIFCFYHCLLFNELDYIVPLCTVLDYHHKKRTLKWSY